MYWASVDRAINVLLSTARAELSPADFSRIVASCKQCRASIPWDVAIRISGCNRLLMATSIFMLAAGRAGLSHLHLGKFIEPALPDAFVSEIDQHSCRNLTHRRVMSATRELKQFLCPHGQKAVRARLVNRTPRTHADLTRPGKITFITYCTDCALVLCSHEEPFRHVDALNLLRTPKIIAEFIDSLESSRYIKPIHNDDARKHRSSQYMGAKQMIDAYRALGVIAWADPGRSRNKVLHLTELGKQLVDGSPSVPIPRDQ